MARPALLVASEPGHRARPDDGRDRRARGRRGARVRRRRRLRPSTPTTARAPLPRSRMSSRHRPGSDRAGSPDAPTATSGGGGCPPGPRASRVHERTKEDARLRQEAHHRAPSAPDAERRDEMLTGGGLMRQGPARLAGLAATVALVGAACSGGAGSGGTARLERYRRHDATGGRWHGEYRGQPVGRLHGQRRRGGARAPKKMGYTVNLKDLKEDVSWQGFESGEVDVILEDWGAPRAREALRHGQEGRDGRRRERQHRDHRLVRPEVFRRRHPEILTDVKNLNTTPTSSRPPNPVTWASSSAPTRPTSSTTRRSSRTSASTSRSSSRAARPPRSRRSRRR